MKQAGASVLTAMVPAIACKPRSKYRTRHVVGAQRCPTGLLSRGSVRVEVCGCADWRQALHSAPVSILQATRRGSLSPSYRPMRKPAASTLHIRPKRGVARLHAVCLLRSVSVARFAPYPHRPRAPAHMACRRAHLMASRPAWQVQAGRPWAVKAQHPMPTPHDHHEGRQFTGCRGASRASIAGAPVVRVAAAQALSKLAVRSGEPYRIQCYSLLRAAAGRIGGCCGGPAADPRGLAPGGGPALEGLDARSAGGGSRAVAVRR